MLRIEYNPYHLVFGKFYRDSRVEIGGKKIWWTKDNAGHAGSTWKLFIEGKKSLVHHKDVDRCGQYIEGKHKGPVGKEINKKDLKGK